MYLGAADGVLKKGPRLKDANGKDLYGASTLTSDVNHDGYADVIVGLTCESIGDETTPEGGSRLMVAYGGQSGQSTGLKPTVISAKTPGLPGAPDPSRCDFGYAPATGDVNGDGYADVALAVPAKDGAMVALVLRGGPKGLTVENAMSVPGLSTRPTLAIQDLNGDGAAELAIGTSYARAADDAVRVLRGGPAGLSTAAPTRIGPADLGLKPAPGTASPSATDTDGHGQPRTRAAPDNWRAPLGRRRHSWPAGSITAHPPVQGRGFSTAARMARMTGATSAAVKPILVLVPSPLMTRVTAAAVVGVNQEHVVAAVASIAFSIM